MHPLSPLQDHILNHTSPVAIGTIRLLMDVAKPMAQAFPSLATHSERHLRLTVFTKSHYEPITYLPFFYL